MDNLNTILFLDDDLNRTDAFLKIIPYAKTTLTAPGMINYLKTAKDIDIVFLDHDLGGEQMVSSNREDCGMEVVRWMVENQPDLNQVIVHSLNQPAAVEMVAKLKDVGYIATYIPFPILLSTLRKSIESNG